MSYDWHSGTPSLREWNGAWRALDSEGEVTQDDWQAAWGSLDHCLSRIGRNGFDDDSDFFVRSTWFKDHRTQVVELVTPLALAMEFLENLQQWLRESFPTWRIIIPLFLGEANVIVVYANVIRGGPEFESDWPAGLACARRAMLELEQFKHVKTMSHWPRRTSRLVAVEVGRNVVEALFMFKNLILLTVAVFFVAMPLPSGAAEFKREIPHAPWESLFFGCINQLTTNAGWKALRAAPLPSQSLEVRIWSGFGLSSLKGYLLRQDGSNWTGFYVQGNPQTTNSVAVQNIAPKSGWGAFWTKLVQLDLLALPDSSTLEDEEMIMDGVCCVVEINKDGRYRTYEYSNPRFQKWPEAKKMVSIMQVINDEIATQ